MLLKWTVYVLFIRTLVIAQSPNVTKVNATKIGGKSCVGDKICVRKCCPFGQVYQSGCNISTAVFNPPIWNNDEVLQGNISNYFNVLIGLNFKCDLKEVKALSGNNFEHHRLLKNGSLLLVDGSFMEAYPPHKFCLDNFVIKNKVVLSSAYCQGPQEPPKVLYKFNSICMLVSCFFFLVTVGLHLWLPGLRTLHGSVLIAVLLSFFVSFLCLAGLNLIGGYTVQICIVFTYIIYFTFLSAFFWMSVMSYDVWRKIRSPTVVSESKGQTRRRFFKYSLYAFSGPCLLTVMVAVLDNVDTPIPLKPNLESQVCFLSGAHKFYYLYVPIIILYIPNAIFFIWIALILFQHQRQKNRIFTTAESRTHNGNRHHFSLCVRIFTLMGISWILEVLSYLYPDQYYIWWFTDAYNLLVGLLIFILVLCKRNIWQMIQNRYRLPRHMLTTSQHTTTSNFVPNISTSTVDEDIPMKPNSKQAEPFLKNTKD